MVQKLDDEEAVQKFVKERYENRAKAYDEDDEEAEETEVGQAACVRQNAARAAAPGAGLDPARAGRSRWRGRPGCRMCAIRSFGWCAAEPGRSGSSRSASCRSLSSGCGAPLATPREGSGENGVGWPWEWLGANDPNNN